MYPKSAREKRIIIAVTESMLGAVRHHGSIPWDSDIDIVIHENNMDRFKTVLEEQILDDYWVDFAHN